jgi:hypothetical protein
LLAAILLPVGPASIAVLRFVMPYYTADSSSEIVRKVAADQTAQSAVVWLGFVAVLTMVPAAWFAGRVVGRSAPRLAAVATPLMVLGYLTLGWLNVGDAALLFGVRHGVSHAVLADMVTSIHPAAGVATILFVIGHVLGTILLGIGMLRGRVVPAWAAWATILAQPIHFTAAIIVPSHPLAGGPAAAGRRLGAGAALKGPAQTGGSTTAPPVRAGRSRPTVMSSGLVMHRIEPPPLRNSEVSSSSTAKPQASSWSRTRAGAPGITTVAGPPSAGGTTIEFAANVLMASSSEITSGSGTSSNSARAEAASRASGQTMARRSSSGQNTTSKW